VHLILISRSRSKVHQWDFWASQSCWGCQRSDFKFLYWRKHWRI